MAETVEKSASKETENKATTDELKNAEEVVVPEDPVRTQKRRTSIGSVVSVLFIAIVAFVVMDEKYLNVSYGAGMSAVQISSYWHKLEFVLCYQSLAISWILFAMFYVISKRLSSGAVDPSEAAADADVVVARNIMQNSIEQFLMSAFAQIISISFIDKSLLIKVIPMINILFLIGRITFWLGYPKYRTFGFMCTAIPNTLLINYNLIKFIQSLFF